MYLQAWAKLPNNVKMKLSKSYGIKWFGTTEQQLDFELSTKLPVGMLDKDVEEVGEPPVSTGKEPQIEPETTEQVESKEEPVETQPKAILEPETPVEDKPKRGRKKK